MSDDKNKLVDTDYNGFLSNIDLQDSNNVRIITKALEKSAEWNGLSTEEREKFMQNPKESLCEIAHKTGMAAVFSNASLEDLRAELAGQDHPDKEGFDAMLEVAIALNETFPFGVDITSDALSQTAPHDAKDSIASSPEPK